MDLDDIDRSLIKLLRSNARLPVATLARRVGLARSTVQERLDRLERIGAIRGYTILLGGGISAPIQAFLFVQAPQRYPAILEVLEGIPEVVAATNLTGDIDMVIEIAAASTERLTEVRAKIAQVDGVHRLTTALVMGRPVERR
jgi:DNA-binding Lrp family transcriptional regulator